MRVDSEFAGKVALVTGGARNVGKAIAKRLAAGGALVVINHLHSPELARQTRAEIEARGGRAEIIRGSVAVEAQVDRIFAEVDARFGGLDILVNNAANGALVASDEVTEQLLDRALETNFKGSFRCVQRAAPLMAARGGGSVVNISTLGGGQFVMASYLACGPAKAALEALTRYQAVDLARHNIRVNTAAAGMLESEVADQFPDAAEMQRAIVAATPMGRLGRPEELAEVVAFLASPRASWITGQLILADGGLATGHALLSPLSRGAPPHASPPAEVGSAPRVSPEEVGSAPRVFPEEVASVAGGSAPRVLPEKVDTEIAVVGMGVAVPGANDPDEYWQELLAGADQFLKIPGDRWDNAMFHSVNRQDEDKTYSERSGFITGFVPDPALREELARDGRDPAAIESTTLWLRHSLRQAMRGVTRRPADRCAFVVGYTADGSQHLEEATVRAGALRRLETVLDEMDVAPDERAEWLERVGRSLSRHYPRSGPDPLRFFPHQVGLHAMRDVLPADTELLMVDTACSSSLYAIDIGLKGLLDGRHDLVVCGGSFAVSPRGLVLFAKLNGLSVRGEVRSLDRDSDGVLFSDGSGAVVLKRLSRALADGDRVLATIRSFGSSSDGKGKAIYAPNADGQKLAIRRALDRPEMYDVRPDWIVAHATGTPAGDLAEFTTLRETVGAQRLAAVDHGRPVMVNSNKSVIGHTGWAAGVASLIEVALGLRHELIPPQHRITAPPEEFEIDTAGLVIPTEAVPWPADPQRRRTAAVSGFGFGGTNAHLVVQEPPPPDELPPADGMPLHSSPATERIAVIGQAVHMDGGPGIAAKVADWLRGAAPAPALSFGDTYPLPSFQKARMPPSAMRAIDRCQLMVLECAHELRGALGSFWEEHRETTGVVLGHMGATRNATLYATRCYLDDLTRALREDPDVAGAPWFPEALQRLTGEVRRLVPASNENTFPGMMPNVIPARVANYFDLKGLNMTVDTGFPSAVSAIDVAGRYLRQGELSMALVGGINGNSTAEVRDLLGDAVDPAAVLAEGAFLFALVTEQTARAAGLEILGFLDTPAVVAAGTVPPDPPDRVRTVECGARRGGRGACFLGAEGAVGILQALAGPPAERDAVVLCRGEDGAASLTLRVSAPVERVPEEPPDAPPDELEPLPVPASCYDEHSYAPGQPLRVTRHVPSLARVPETPIGDRVPFWPEQPTVVLTDQPELLAGIGLPAATLVLSTRDVGGDAGGGAPRETRDVGGDAGGGAPRESPVTAYPDRGFHHLERVDPAAVRRVLDGRDPITQVRLVTDLGRTGDPAGAGSPALTALHDLLFLTLQHCWQSLAHAEGASCVALLVDGLVNAAPRPFTGLFTGLLKVLHLELPTATSYAVVTSATDLATAVEQAERESALSRQLPVAYYVDGARHGTTLTEEPGELVPPGAARLGRESVVVAVGGGRGITAELVTELARHFSPRLFILGSNPIVAEATAGIGHLLALGDDEFVRSRPEFIRQRLADHPGRTPADISREFQRIGDARLARRNLDRMARHTGAGRVSYLTCDVTDHDQVVAAMAEVVRAAGKIDLLINAAGVNRSTPIASKSFAEFRTVRDRKLRGYQNLRSALRDNPPRTWCNFGSLLGMTGQIGEADYASANDFLGAAATYHSQVSGEDELTIGWTLWGEVGLGANDLTRSYFEKSGIYSNMSTAEGVHHFIRELNLAKPSPYTIHLGEAERGAIEGLLPGFLRTPAPAGPSGEPVGFYLGRVRDRGDDWVLFERDFDLATDPYLRHHLVNGVPTLPGAFVCEIAFEAASALVPELRVFAFEDLSFRNYLKVREGDRSGAKKIWARVVERRPDLDQAVVEVRVTTDVVAPNGTLLVRDKPHFEARVLMAGDLPAAPRWQPWHPASETPVDDPYHYPASPVLLTDMFAATTETRLHPLGKRAMYTLALPAGDPVFSRFHLPTILIDGLARTGVLALAEDGLIPLAAPLRVGRVDLYAHGSDVEVAAQHGHLDLYVRMPGAAADGSDPGTGNRFVAVRPDGRILLQMKDLSWTLLGYLRRDTGEFLTPEEKEEVTAMSKAETMGKAEAGAAVDAPAPADGLVPAETPMPVGRRPPPVSRDSRRKRAVPGPRGLGTVPRSLRAWQRNAPQFFLDLHREYGDMVRVPLGFFTVYLPNHPDAIRYVLQDNNRNYVRGKGYDRFKIFMGIGLLTTDGEEWRQRRQIVNPLFHKSAIADMAGTMASSTTAVLDRWEREQASARPVDVVPEMMELTLGALGRIMFDADLAPESARVGPAMWTSLEAMVFRGTLPQLTPDFMPIPYNLRIRRSKRVMYRIVDRIVESHRTIQRQGKSDLVDLLLSARDAETGGELPRQQIRDELMTIFMAGHETTGTGLAWALYELARNPDVQERLSEEAEQVLAGREATLADLEQLRYTRMVIDETLRLHPPIWGYPRDSLEEDEIDGWRLPAKSTVFVVPYVAHRHPDYWVLPERFDPERFSPDRQAQHPRYAYFPFGGGQRKCIGNQMALLQTHLSLAMIAQRFRLRLAPDHRIELGTVVSFRPMSGIRLVLEPRRR